MAKSSVKQLEQRRKNVAAEAAKRRAATHCQKGHEYTKETTYVRRNGRRTCRICKQDAEYAYNQLRKRRRLRGTQTPTS